MVSRRGITESELNSVQVPYANYLNNPFLISGKPYCSIILPNYYTQILVFQGHCLIHYFGYSIQTIGEIHPIFDHTLEFWETVEANHAPQNIAELLFAQIHLFLLQAVKGWSFWNDFFHTYGMYVCQCLTHLRAWRSLALFWLLDFSFKWTLTSSMSSLSCLRYFFTNLWKTFPDTCLDLTGEESVELAIELA